VLVSCRHAWELRDPEGGGIRVSDPKTGNSLLVRSVTPKQAKREKGPAVKKKEKKPGHGSTRPTKEGVPGAGMSKVKTIKIERLVVNNSCLKNVERGREKDSEKMSCSTGSE